jgi:hypothetical protein
MDALDRKVDQVREDLSRQMLALDGKLGAWMRWLVGIVVVVMAGQVGILVQAVLR